MEKISRQSPAPEKTVREPAGYLGRHGESAWLFFPWPVIITDVENRILSANPAARKLIGHESGENLWHRLGTVHGLPELTRPSVNGDLVPWSGTVHVESNGPDPRPRRLHVIMRPIAETGGGDAARLWILEDRDRDRAYVWDRERLALRERAAMAAEIAHDLNNYLAVINGNAELLAMYINKGAYDNVPRCLENLRKTLTQVETFTDRCLHLRHPLMDDGTIDVNRFLSDQIAFLRPQRPFRKILVATEFSDGLPAFSGDPADLQHAFYAIMRNAAEALHEAAAEQFTITVRTESVTVDEVQMVRIIVADDGPGISADVRDRIFREPVTNKPGHAGFGLLTVAVIARKLRGRASIIDRPDGGAAIALTLPAIDTAT